MFRWNDIEPMWFVAGGGLLAIAVLLFGKYVAFDVFGFLFLLATVPASQALSRGYGQKKASVVLMALLLFFVLVDAIALRTGFPFGRFEYFDWVGKALPGGTPWFLPFVSTSLLLAATAAASRRFQVPWMRFFLTAFILGGFMLAIHPPAVALGMWRFEGIPGGVPVFAYFGWILTGLAGAILLFFLLGHGWFALEKHAGGLVSSALVLLSFWTLLAVETGAFLSAFIGASTVYFLLRITYRQHAISSVPS